VIERRPERLAVLGLASWLACTALGLLLIDVDSGPTLVSLTSGHGLTAIDAAGVTAIIAGSAAPLLICRRELASRQVPAQRRLASGVAVVAGVGVLAVSLLVPDFAGRKFVLATLVVMLQATAGFTAIARQDHRWRASCSGAVDVLAARNGPIPAARPSARTPQAPP
jgi:hypothetical protein